MAATSLRTAMPSAPKLLSSWKICLVATPLAFQEIQVSTVVAAHWMSPDAIARCRSFCGIFFNVTSRPFFLKMPDWLARVSGAKPVHPESPIATFTSSAIAGADASRAADITNVPTLRMVVFLCCFMNVVRSILVSLSTAIEAGNQLVRLAGIDEAHGRQRSRDAPGVTFDHQAGRADRDLQRLRGLLVGYDGADRMLGFRPRHVMEQPRAGRVVREIRCGRLGHRVDIDKPVLERERHVIGAMTAFDCNHPAGFRHPQASAIGRIRGASRALDQLIAIVAAERADFGADVRDLEDRRQILGTAHKAAGAPPPLDQLGLRQLRQRLVHRHPRAAIARHDLMLERDAVTRRPVAGQNSTLDVEPDLLVQRRLVQRRLVQRRLGVWLEFCSTFCAICGETHATSLRTASLNASRAWWRRRCRPSSTTFLPPDQTQLTASAPAAKIQPSRTASARRPASDGCLVFRETMSARAPG